jgi:hypothetical protein
MGVRGLGIRLNVIVLALMSERDPKEAIAEGGWRGSCCSGVVGFLRKGVES